MNSLYSDCVLFSVHLLEIKSLPDIFAEGMVAFNVKETINLEVIKTLVNYE